MISDMILALFAMMVQPAPPQPLSQNGGWSAVVEHPMISHADWQRHIRGCEREAREGEASINRILSRRRYEEGPQPYFQSVAPEEREIARLICLSFTMGSKYQLERGIPMPRPQ